MKISSVSAVNHAGPSIWAAIWTSCSSDESEESDESSESFYCTLETYFGASQAMHLVSSDWRVEALIAPRSAATTKNLMGN